jgi:microcystin degradation protein MlrC
MRFVIAMMLHETNTFSPVPTPYEAFGATLGLDRPPRGTEILETHACADVALAAFVDLAKQVGAEVSLPIAAYAEPSGPVADEAFDRIAAEICEAVAKGCDAVLLDLHGAMVTESHDDGEGELLKRIRAVDADVPIAVALDFHANLTADMAENATVITGYRTYPHVDIYETGRRAGRILMRALRGEAAPRIVWGRAPMLTHMIQQTPSRQPMKDIMDLAIASEADDGILDVSLFGGFPLSDIPDSGLSSLVIADGDVAAAETLSRRLLSMAWQRRADFIFEPEALSDTIARAKRLEGGLVVIADHGDNCGAGGPSDDMTVIAEALHQGLNPIAAGPIWDSVAVSRMVEAGVGAELTISIGGKTSSPAMARSGRPLELSGVVKEITDGRFRIEGPMMTGFMINLGRTVRFEAGALDLVVSEQRTEPYDPGIFAHVGIDLATKAYVIVKSRQHFRAGFEELARHILLAAGHGVCSSDYAAFPFKRLARPIYPLDPEMTWSPGS